MEKRLKKLNNKEYEETLKRYLRNALFVGIPEDKWVAKNMLTVIWKNNKNSVFTWQINAKNHFRNLWAIGRSIERIKEKREEKT